MYRYSNYHEALPDKNLHTLGKIYSIFPHHRLIAQIVEYGVLVLTLTQFTVMS